MKISKKADPNRLNPGTEVTFDRDGNIIPIPVPTPPFVIAQKLVRNSVDAIESLNRFIRHDDECLEIFSDETVQSLEDAQRLLERCVGTLREESGFEI